MPRLDDYRPGSPLVAFDTETALVEPGLLAPELVCGSFAEDDRPAGWADPVLLDADRTVLHLLEVMRRQSRPTLVGAQIVYDLAVVLARRPDLLKLVFSWFRDGRVHDVQISQALHQIALGRHEVDEEGHKTHYSLKDCVRMVLGRDDAKRYDTWRLSYALLRDIPMSEWPEDARLYPLDDARNPLLVARKQVAGHANLHDLTRQTRAAWAMHLGALWGLRTDPERVAALEERVTRLHQERVERFTAQGFLRPDGSECTAVVKREVAVAYGADPNQTCVACQGTGRYPSPKTGKPITHPACDGTGLWLPPQVPRTDKGRIRADRDAKLDSGDETLRDYADDVHEKILETYLPWLKVGTDRPINLSPKVLLSSGRASYRGLVQLMPRSGGVRECFRARPGYVYCSCDYAGIELVTLAQCVYWICKRSRMMEVINEGKDLHSAFGAAMAGVPYEDFVRALKDKDHPRHKEYKELRQKSKAANFGFPGGMGAPKFVLAKRREGYRLCGGCRRVDYVSSYRGRPCEPVCSRCLTIAAQLRQDWFDQWPEMPQYFQHANDVADEVGAIEQFVSGRVRGGVGMTDAANGYFQGLAADGAKHALWRVTEECYLDDRSPLYGTRPVAFIHDEILAEMPEERAWEAGPRMAELMVEAMREFTPDVKVKVEPALMRYWYKEAEPAFDEKGRLIPWEPR